ncbi:unnamed protein product [Rotaria socialis]|uniref:Uncharacterized protein n=1 Tax=Rotaria socialis TaxID=392032 RepID=A0A818K1I6_9BILA|nr:unnamed protein product [Rotaria socialis]
MDPLQSVTKNCGPNKESTECAINIAYQLSCNKSNGGMQYNKTTNEHPSKCGPDEMAVNCALLQIGQPSCKEPNRKPCETLRYSDAFECIYSCIRATNYITNCSFFAAYEKIFNQVIEFFLFYKF